MEKGEGLGGKKKSQQLWRIRRGRKTKTQTYENIKIWGNLELKSPKNGKCHLMSVRCVLL